MRHWLFLIILTISMAFGGYGKVSAASLPENDRVQEIEHKEHNHEATLSDGSGIYRVCNSRPQRLLPSWSLSIHQNGSKLPYYHKLFQSLLTQFGGKPRSETAPFHFDVASEYYVIYLRHLRC